MDRFAARRQRLAEKLPGEGLDGYLISSPFNVTWLTGFSGEASWLLVGPGRAVLVSDRRFTRQIEEECPGLEFVARPPTQRLVEAIAEQLAALGFRKIGFESAIMTVADFEALREALPACDWKATSDRVEDLRMVKDDQEIAAIRRAIALAEKTFTVLRAFLQPDQTEKELCDAIEHYARLAGGSGTSFPPIVAVGERAALPHAPPTGKRVAEGEMLLVDWGVTGRLYRSDLTRVLAVRRRGNSPATVGSPRLEEIHAVVLEAQRRAIAAVRPGVKAESIDAAARQYIAEAGYGENFGHGLGHGFGLQIHEAPAIRPRSQVEIVPGMVFTIEPGIYLPGWGGVRIEDDVLVTPDGCEVLTSVPRDLSPAFDPNGW